MRPSTRNLLVVSGIIVTTACTDPRGAADAAVVRDSAGIEIVENAAPLLTGARAWRLSDEPVLSIGELEGPAEYQMHHVTGALRLLDGRIVVGNAGTHELRYYDSDGAFLIAAGRKGGGPGEFEGIGSLYPASDTVFVFDWSTQRISAFDTGGGFVEAIPIPVHETGLLRAAGRFADGSWGVLRTISGNGSQRREGLIQDSIRVSRFPASGGSATPLGMFPATEQFRQVVSVGAGVVGMTTTPPFARVSTLEVRGNAFLFGNGDSYEIAEYGGDGRLQRLIRRNFDPAPVDAADLSFLAALDEQSRAESPPGFELSGFADMPRPAHKPAYRSFDVDALGFVWVWAFALDHEAPWSASVFDPTGRWTTDITIPAGFQPLEIGDDYVLGVARDDLEVERVQMYALIKP